jgi:SAM-dependent methyltransferase
VRTLRSTTSWDLLREAASAAPALPALSAEQYARTHAVYEAASDQRVRLQAWLTGQLPPLLPGSDPVRVLGVGVGDGTVDAPLAAALVAGGRRVYYTGVEPHPASAARFVGRLAALGADGLVPAVVIGEFADHDPGAPVDVVHFVHSLYYVADLGAALDHALAVVRPGGLVVAATAPREPLCALTELLCPWDGHRPWFAEDVRAELDLRGLDVREERLVGRLDVRDVLADPEGRCADVLDFLVGAGTAAMHPDVRRHLLAHLAELAEPGHTGSVPHPLDVVVARAPGLPGGG